MRKPERRRVVRALIIILLLLVSAAWLIPDRPGARQGVERLIAARSNALQTRDFLSFHSERFVIKYLPVDEKYVAIIAAGSEQAYEDVVQWFKTDAPPSSPELIVYPTGASLALSFGWDHSQQSMGVYWGGGIHILSPAEWMESLELEEFYREGPMVHELAHWMIDEVSGGNYSRWFTEGLAQYLEKQINGFAFAPPEMTAGDIMLFSELEQNFDGERRLNAYWQALQTVEYIEQAYGEDSLRAILAELRQGARMNLALQKALHTEFTVFERDCHRYIEQQIAEVSK